jgi:hypothetical protein
MIGLPSLIADLHTHCIREESAYISPSTGIELSSKNTWILGFINAFITYARLVLSLYKLVAFALQDKKLF